MGPAKTYPLSLGIMQSILVSGYNHFNYLDSIASGFQAAGMQTFMFAHPNVGLDKKNHPNLIKRIKARTRIAMLNRKLLHMIRRCKPDLVLCINGESLLPKTLNEIKRHSILANWVVDGVNNLRISPEQLDIYPHIFLFEPDDIKVIKHGSYLSYGFDSSIYRPLNIKESYDVIFAGSPHTGRLPVLEMIARYCREQGITFGVFGPGYLRSDALKQQYPDLARSIITNRRLEPEEINRIYNQSRIILNIHHEQSMAGINPRTFEIAAAGRFQLVDYHDRLPDFFMPGLEVAVYNKPEEMPQIITHFLKHTEERKKIADKAYSKALSAHQFKHRCRTMIDAIDASVRKSLKNNE